MGLGFENLLFRKLEGGWFLGDKELNCWSYQHGLIALLKCHPRLT